MTMAESAGDASATDVVVVTDLAITGKPAQFGRGVMQDVSDKLLNQFVACLEQRLGDSPPAPGAAPAAAPVPAVDTVTPPAAEPEPTLTDESAPAAVETPPVAAAPAAPEPAPASAPVPAAAARRAVPARRTTTPSTWAPPCCRSCSRPTGSRGSPR